MSGPNILGEVDAAVGRVRAVASMLSAIERLPTTEYGGPETRMLDMADDIQSDLWSLQAKLHRYFQGANDGG